MDPISTSDYLWYRFPGEEKHTYRGILENTKLTNSSEGFIFTDFLNENQYIFNKKSTSEEMFIHFHTAKPYVFTQREYLNQATAFHNCIQQMQIGKAVFSRIKTTIFDSTKTIELFHALCNQYPSALVYLISSKLIGTWIGASPEILLHAHDDYLFTMSLAGTKKSNENEVWTEKEMIEQELVTDFISDELKKILVNSLEIIGPYDFEAGPVTHLRSDISAEISGIPLLEIAEKLHPTPAVSGIPRQEAITLIQATETHQRDLYTGIVGCIQKHSARLFVNLRCAQIQAKNAYLYLGGGFTAQSIPENEWQETENKSKTLLNVMKKL